MLSKEFTRPKNAPGQRKEKKGLCWEPSVTRENPSFCVRDEEPDLRGAPASVLTGVEGKKKGEGREGVSKGPLQVRL